jgi:hypothetical protein
MAVAKVLVYNQRTTWHNNPEDHSRSSCDHLRPQSAVHVMSDLMVIPMNDIQNFATFVIQLLPNFQLGFLLLSPCATKKMPQVGAGCVCGWDVTVSICTMLLLNSVPVSQT